MTTDTRNMYYLMFKELFKVLAQVGQSPITFQHIHGYGLVTIGVDMCNKQAGGFGDYLAEIAPDRTWDEHLQHMLVFCQVHVRRNFMEKYQKHPVFHYIKLLWTDVDNLSALKEHIQSICVTFPEMKSWYANKETNWILAGLSAKASKVPYEWRKIARKDTNASESSHAQDNFFTGTKNALLHSILKYKKTRSKQSIC
jgi:hypothetical protein